MGRNLPQMPSFWIPQLVKLLCNWYEGTSHFTHHNIYNQLCNTITSDLS